MPRLVFQEAPDELDLELEHDNGSMRAAMRAVADSDAPVRGRVDSLLGELGRLLGGQVAVLCALDGSAHARVVAAWGIDRDLEITLPEDWGTTRHGGRREPDGCFLVRALAEGRPVLEALDPARDASLIDASPAGVTHALAVPVDDLDGDRQMAIVIAFSTVPRDVGRELWMAETYARLVALAMSDTQALGGLLEHGHRDALTGCLTYETVLYELVREINRSARGGLALSCFFIDLDDFKGINDDFGHLHGNEILAQVGLMLRQGVRNCDTIGRYGGDEFIAILPQTDDIEAAFLAERLRARLSSRSAERFGEQVTASIGVAAWAPGMSGAQLLARADRALYAAKAISRVAAGRAYRRG